MLVQKNQKITATQSCSADALSTVYDIGEVKANGATKLHEDISISMIIPTISNAK